jgi:hypothetical protein
LGVYLTFDGAVNEYTAQALDILNAAGKTAAFFLAADGAREYPDAVRQIAARHVLGGLAPSDALALEAESRALRAVGFVYPRLARLSGDADDGEEDIAEHASAAGYRLWGTTVDCAGLAADAALKLMPKPGDGPAVLRFDFSEETCAMLPDILAALDDEELFYYLVIDYADRPVG